MNCKLCGNKSDIWICRGCLAYYAFSCDTCAEFSLKADNHCCQGKDEENIAFDRKCSFEGCNDHTVIREWFEPGDRTCPRHSID